MPLKIWRGPIRHYETQTRWIWVWWVRCPQCNQVAMADAEQMIGKVSFLCDCGYHVTERLIEEQELPDDGKL